MFPEVAVYNGHCLTLVDKSTRREVEWLALPNLGANKR